MVRLYDTINDFEILQTLSIKLTWSHLLNLICFIGISMVLTITPGPDNLYVITQSIIQGKKAGIFTSLGLCTGLIVHTTVAALGVSVILQQSVIAFNILKYAGAI